MKDSGASKEGVYTREEYWKTFFPAETQEKLPEAETPFELGTKLGDMALTNLRSTLRDLVAKQGRAVRDSAPC
jgi:hypothetical protein